MTLRIILKLASAAPACCPCRQTRPLPNASLQRITRVLCATMSKSSGILLHEIFQVVTYFHNECAISVYFSKKKDPICFLTRSPPLASSCHCLHIMHGISVVRKLCCLSVWRICVHHGLCLELFPVPTLLGKTTWCRRISIFV